MRLHRHLNEEVSPAVEAWELIKKKCKPYLKEWIPIVRQGRPEIYLWRGMNKPGGEYGEKDVRTDRKPEASDHFLHKEMDKAMKKKFGIAGRTNTVFATSEKVTYYGERHMIFPVGKYKILWSPKIRDLYQAMKLSYGYSRHLKKDSMRSNEDIYRYLADHHIVNTEEAREEAYNILLKQNHKGIADALKTYKLGDLKGAIKSQNEVMIECESYIYVRQQWATEISHLGNR